jgi:hypothetical protein
MVDGKDIRRLKSLSAIPFMDWIMALYDKNS